MKSRRARSSPARICRTRRRSRPSWIEPVFARSFELVRANPGASRWRPDQIPLLVLAFYNVVVGYFTIAPLYAELSGEDPLGAPAVARQIEFFADLVELLLGDAPANRSAEKP